MSNRRTFRLFAPQRRRPIGCLLVALLLLAALLMVLSLNSLSNRYVRLETRRVTVLNLPKQLEGFTILHLSDLNAASLGHKQENLKSALGQERYEAVVLSGDMVGKSGRVQPLLEILDLIPENVPVFLVAGDSDPPPMMDQPHGDGEVLSDYLRQAQAHGAIYLEIPYPLESGGRTIWFCPGDLFLIDLDNAYFALREYASSLQAAENPYEPLTGARLRHTQHRLAVMEASREAMKQMREGDIIIAVMHHPPDSMRLGELSQQVREAHLPSPSLFLAGQFNNGQVRLPGLGPVYIPPQPDGSGGFFPGDEGFTGLSITKGYPVHISPGLGVSGYYPLPLRLFNRPAATLLVLTAHMTR